MEFKRKLKIRLYVAISYIILGVAMIAASLILKISNNFISSFGFALFIIGIVRTRSYRLITKNEETIRKQMIAETDERNVAIAHKAKSLSFMIYLFLVSVTVIVLELLNKIELAIILAGTVGFLVLLYWICYFVIRKRS